MTISFVMNDLKDMKLLYSCTVENSQEYGTITAEYYNGKQYCENIVNELQKAFEREKCQYIGSYERIGNETYLLTDCEDLEYTLSFDVDTYERSLAQLTVKITTANSDNYNHRLEKIKIRLKNILLNDWNTCTWLEDEQALMLCNEIYARVFTIENQLRAFVSKVLIHHCGTNWLNQFGLEKYADSVSGLNERFVNRVPEFDNINADFFSMTLETLVEIMFKGVVYQNIITLSREDYKEIQKKKKIKPFIENIPNYLDSKRTVEMSIWIDLFRPLINDEEKFRSAIHNFIESRNHIAHSKILSWSAYRVILEEFTELEEMLQKADEEFNTAEMSDQIQMTVELEQEENDYDKEYYRDRLAGETGMEILEEHEIADKFAFTLHELYNEIYQHYHFDVGYKISEFADQENAASFTVTCAAVDDGSAEISVRAEYFIDDNLGEDSTCRISAQNAQGEELAAAEIIFHNGNGFENEDGLMEATDSTEFDTNELDEFKQDLYAAIDTLNPYEAKLNSLAYECKGSIRYVAEYECEQCGNLSVSINEDFLPIGKCYRCGLVNEMTLCARCGQLVPDEYIQHNLCPSCADYVEDK